MNRVALDHLVFSSSLFLVLACGSSGKSSAGGGGEASANGGASAVNGGSTSGGSASGGAANGGAQSLAGNSSTSGGSTASQGGATSSSGGRASGGAAAAGASNGGTNASGGASAGSANAGAPAGDDSVLERNNHPSRDGHFLQPSLTKAAIAKFASDTEFAAKFTGNMWASPLYFANGPGGKGLYFAVTTGNDVFALDATTGSTTWTKHIGDSPTSTGVSCGNIKPVGILSTPVIDAAARTIYVVGAIGTTGIQRHELHALSIDDGSERPNYPVDLSKISAGSVTMAKPAAFNQRSALSLVNGIVYVAFGGHVGDCDNYRGWVTAVDTKSPTNAGAWAALGERGEGIWTAGGMASDGAGVFAVTGNNTAGVSSHANSDSEEVLRLTGLAKFDRSNKNMYFPSNWRTMDSADADFGAVSPLYLEMQGSTPPSLVVAISKDGHFHLLDSTNLGGTDGSTPLVDFQVSNGAMSIHTVPAAYKTAQGQYITLSTDAGALCPSGGASGRVVMGVLLPPGAPPAPKVQWCAPLSGTVTAPIATTTDGSDNAVVWYISGTKLTAVDGDTGQNLYTSSDTCSGVRQWTSPIAVGGHVVVGADAHLCSWSAH